MLVQPTVNDVADAIMERLSNAFDRVTKSFDPCWVTNIVYVDSNTAAAADMILPLSRSTTMSPAPPTASCARRATSVTPTVQQQQQKQQQQRRQGEEETETGEEEEVEEHQGVDCYHQQRSRRDSLFNPIHDSQSGPSAHEACADISEAFCSTASAEDLVHVDADDEIGMAVTATTSTDDEGLVR